MPRKTEGGQFMNLPISQIPVPFSFLQNTFHELCLNHIYIFLTSKACRKLISLLETHTSTSRAHSNACDAISSKCIGHISLLHSVPFSNVKTILFFLYLLKEEWMSDGASINPLCSMNPETGVRLPTTANISGE